MSSCMQIKLSNDKVIYSPGEKVIGTVSYKDSLSELNALTIRFRGKSHTGWYDAARKIYYEKEEYYIDNTQSLWPKESQDFSFEFHIPENAPCSFEGSSGWVRYTMYVTVDRSNHFDKVKKIFLTVLSKADLNLDPRALLQPHLELKEGVGFLSSKFVTINASCNKGGYVPGEPIQVLLDINNTSDKDISKITVVLEEKAAFTGKCLCDLRRVDKRSAAKVVEKTEIKKNSQRVWRSSIRVPSLPPSDLRGCSIIDLQYRLLITLKCGTLSKISFKIPFIIGTVPLQSGNDQTSFPQPSLDDAPPTYMESVFGGVDGVEDDKEELLDENYYSPRYNYYQWSSS